MKKLLSLLSALSILTSSTISVIACGDGNNESELVPDPVEPEINYEQLASDFETDLTKIKDDYWVEKKDSFFATADSSLYQFLNKTDIKNIVDSNGDENKVVTGSQLGSNDQNKLKNDINSIIELTDINNKFNEGINQEKYSVLISSINWKPTEIQINWETLKVSYTTQSVTNSDETTTSTTNEIINKAEGKSANDDDFLSYTDVDLKFNFKYLDKNAQEKTLTITQKFIFTLSGNQVLIDSIKNMEEKIKADYFLEGEEFSFLDKENLGFSSVDENLQQIFNTSSSSMLDKFKDVYQTENFKTEMTTFLENKYFTKLQNIPLKFTGDIIFNNYIESDYLKADTKIEKDISNYPADKSLYNSIFSVMEETGGPVTMFGQSKKVNTFVYNYLRENYKDFYKNYNDKLIKFVNSLGTSVDTTKIIDKLNNSFSYGTIKLSGLTIDLGSYKHPINDLSIYSSIAVKNDETKEDREEVTKSNLFGAMYYNTIAGIKKYQEIFGITPRSDDGDKGISSPLAKFTGMRTGNTDPEKNIWKDITVNGNQYFYNLNDSLSLYKQALSTYRNTLLSEGNQKKFNWAFYKPSSYTTYANVWMTRPENGVAVGGHYYSGEESLLVNFEQNFINIFFKVSGVWKTKDFLILEKVSS